MGYKSIVVSPTDKYPGTRFADKHIDADTTDLAKICELIKNLKIDAVVTTGTDVAVPVIGELVDLLGLCGTGAVAARKSMDKMLMKAALVAKNVTTAKYQVVKTVEEAETSAEELGYPVIVKAVDSSGRRGVKRVNERHMMVEAFS
ncbi:MAG: hypothetical protein U5K72_03545 [Balneolaceae bacterium]|nr:hypothetical protein [Balneolaceae bacterium]